MALDRNIITNTRRGYPIPQWAWFFFALLGACANVEAHIVSKSLSLTAYIMKNEVDNGIRIEAEQYNFTQTYLWSTGKFQDVRIPFKVFAKQSYQLEINQFYYRCRTQSAPQWQSREDLLDVYFDKAPTPLVQNDTSGGAKLVLPDKNYEKPAAGGEQVGKNPYPSESWDAWYRHHQFDIVHGELPQTDEEQACQGMIGIIATSLL